MTLQAIIEPLTKRKDDISTQYLCTVFGEGGQRKTAHYGIWNLVDYLEKEVFKTEPQTPPEPAPVPDDEIPF